MKTTNLKRGMIIDIARLCNVTHSAVSQWFTGRTTPSLRNALKIQKEFNIPVDAWLDIKSYLNNAAKSGETATTKPKEGV